MLELLTMLLSIILVERLSARASVHAAIQWGEPVKAAYDVYLPALRKTMQASEVGTAAESSTEWSTFSQAVIYRRPDVLPWTLFQGKEDGADRAPPAGRRGSVFSRVTKGG